MNREDLYEAVGQADEKKLLRSERPRRHFRPWMASAAALLALVLTVGLFRGLPRAGDSSNPQPDQLGEAVQKCALMLPEYPVIPPYPEEPQSGTEEAWATHEAAYTQWSDSKAALLPQDRAFAQPMIPFFQTSMQEFLGQNTGENALFSPLNLYFALSMLAETTGGESRQQLLSLLGAENLEALRTQTETAWKASYQNDGATTTILASSLWLNQDTPVKEAPLKALAQHHYAAAFQGEMGSSDYHQAIQDWVNAQTGGLLSEYAEGLDFTPDTVLALISTLYYQAKWSDGFSPDKTAPRTFHAPGGDLSRDFMHQSIQSDYWWFDRFGAVSKRLENGGGSIWFLLPDEGVAAEELLTDPQAMDFLFSSWQEREERWGGSHSKFLTVHLALPKFDLSQELNLSPSLDSLGLGGLLSPETADFSPLTDNPLFLSSARQALRVAIDEEGVTAAAYTAMACAGAAMPPEEEMDFVLDRPFLFVVQNELGLPLFTGIVRQP